MKNRRFAARLGFAWAGIRAVFRRERSFRAQLMLGGGAMLALAALRPGLVWTALVLLAAALVLALEMVNAALEALMDKLHPGFSEEIGAAKDAAAGAALIASFFAAAIGALMLLSRL
jgi:diacylglycerol kinase (ATP)